VAHNFSIRTSRKREKTGKSETSKNRNKIVEHSYEEEHRSGSAVAVDEE
jgi:hypothetical protein